MMGARSLQMVPSAPIPLAPPDSRFCLAPALANGPSFSWNIAAAASARILGWQNARRSAGSRSLRIAVSSSPDDLRSSGLSQSLLVPSAKVTLYGWYCLQTSFPALHL